MIGKGKSISHGVAALEYDLAKEINGQAVATEIARHELYGCTGAEMVQETKPYHIDFPNVKNNCLRFEVSPSIEESATFTDADWAELGKRGFKVREARASTGKLNGYYVTARSGTEYKASEIGKGYTLAHIERTQSKLKYNSMNISHGNKLTSGSGSFHR